jgi:hypothetical protein
LISACSLSFSIMALAIRATMRSVLGAVEARARDLGGILGGGGLMLAADMPDSCRRCFRGMWNDML